MQEKKRNPHAGHRAKLKRRFIRQGLDDFEEHNILELILFFAIPRRDTNEIAHALLDRFGSFSAVFEASIEELCSVAGIGENSAHLIKTYPAVAKRYYQDRFGENTRLPDYDRMGKNLVLQFAGAENEQVLALFYDSSFGFRGKTMLHEGNINSVSFSFRKVCDAALQYNAAYMILAHNHPRGIPIASADDLSTTTRLKNFLNQINVILLDHFIIGEGNYTSIQENVYHDHLYVCRNDEKNRKERLYR